MAFEILSDPEEPWLRKGHYVQLVDGAKAWGDKYKYEWYRVIFYEMTRRDYRKGFLPAAATSALLVDPKVDMGLEPRYYATIYQTRIGISDGWNFYIQWPSGTYRMMLQDPQFVTDPMGTGTTLHKKYIGFLDSADSPLDLPKLQFFLVKDHMPIFYAAVNSPLDYEAIILRVRINKIRLMPVALIPPEEGGGDTKLADLKSGRQISKPIYHYSAYQEGETWI